MVVVLQRRSYQISLGGSVQDLQGSVLKIPSGIRGKNSSIQVTFLAEIVTVRTKQIPASITDKLERAPQITRDRAKDSHKIFERHIYDSLNTHLSRNNLLYGLQLVLEKKHSTETALIRQKLRVWSCVR